VSVHLTAHGKIVNNAPIRPVRRARSLTAKAVPPACGSDTISEKSLVSDVIVNAEIEGADGLTGKDGKGCAGQDVFLVAILGRVHVRAKIKSGSGGPGRDDTKPTTSTTLNACRNDHKSVMPLKGKPGGNGGDIEFRKGEPVVRPGTLVPGKGGPGGDAGSRGVPTPAPNGTAGHAGSDVIAESGAGGEAGRAFWRFGALSDRHPLVGAKGGQPGSIYVRAGEGGSPNCDGGQTDAILGEHGSSSPGPNGPGPPPEVADAIVINGGNAFPEASKTADQPGGRGGMIRLREWLGTELISPVFIKKITITAAANGGPGFMGCGSTIQPGTNGGDGGRFTMLTSITNVFIDGSFNGARGGDGAPSFGFGGFKGSSDVTDLLHNTASFQPGTDGATCPNAAFQYEFKDVNATWTSPFDPDARPSGTVSGTLCGSASQDIWTVEKLEDGKIYRDFLRFKPGLENQTLTMAGYRNLDGSFVADANIHVSLSGEPPDVTLSFTPAPLGSTSFLSLTPPSLELHGLFVGTADDCH
jgi:hypothetical protein